MMERAALAPILAQRRHLPWYLELWVRMVREKPLGAIGGALVLILLLAAILADVLAPYGYNSIDPYHRLQPYSSPFWLGSDNLGRDVLSRIIYGARISIYVGLGAVGIGKFFATVLGVTSAYFGGRLDALVQRVVDAMMSFPSLVLLLSLLSIMGPGLAQVIAGIAVIQTFSSSRVIRGAAMTVKENMYVEAARAIGAGHGRIILRHILPNVMAPIIILATVALGNVILLEASVSFLGYGIPPPHPSWGGMLSGTGREFMYDAPWMAIWPGVALSLTVFGFNMMGDALRDLLDPRLRGGGGRFQ